RADLDRLLAATRPRPLAAGTPHIEVDLARQVLLVVEADGVVRTILPVSSGSGRQFVSQGWARNAVTHPGWYTVDKKAPGWNRSPLGLLYYPFYFMWGTAIHGAPSVPARPDSHGCVRIPIFAARRLYEMTPLGTLVIVHRGGLPPRPPAVLLPIVDSVVEVEQRD
ncbi:MAG: L,D-transpeptidase, partial [Acidobacteriota bacterium]